MKTKRLLALILALVFAAACLGACGSADSSTADSAAEESEAAQETEAAGSSETMTLIMATAYNEGSVQHDLLMYMVDYIEEATSGAITFQTYVGGTLCTMAEEFSYVQSGAIDLACVMQGMASSAMPLWQIGALGLDAESGVEIFNYVANENEETSALMQAQAEEAGVHAFGYNIGDYNGIVCKSYASTLSDLDGRAFGIPAQGASVYEALGMSTVTCETSDAYESLSRGVVDTFCAGISSIVNMNLCEVAESCIVITATGGTGIIMLNDETWNSLTQEQQEIFDAAYEEALAYMIEQYDTVLMPEYEAAIEAECELVYLEGEELDEYIEIKTESGVESYVSAAETLDCLDDYYTVNDTATAYAESLR